MKFKISKEGFIFVASIIATATDCSSPCTKKNACLHELLTDEEFSRVFRTTRDNVPAYEVVPIMHNLYKRSSENLRMQFNAFDTDYDIHLNPSNGILAGENTPVWLASPGTNGTVNYKKMDPNIMGTVSQSFLSLTSAFMVDDSEDKLPRFEGTVEDMFVTSWPARVEEVTKVELDKRFPNNSVNSRPTRTLIPTGYHAIIKSKRSLNDYLEAFEKVVDEMLRGPKPLANRTIYPSILITTDYSGTPKTQDESKFYGDIRYQLAFWNSVDLHFRDLENPKLRLRIAGIVIGQGRSAIPYIDKFMNEKNKLNVYKAISYKMKYWNEQASNPDFKPDAYDVIITLTDAKMYSKKKKLGVPIGLATVRSFCDVPTDNKYHSVGIVNDNAAFSGILTAAHELGHILGVEHDTDSSGDCSNSSGYIMSPKRSRTLMMHRWSPCSIKRIRQVLRFGKHCADEPAEFHNPGKEIYRIAPGDIVNDQLQCEGHGFSWACKPEPKICKKLQCWSDGFYGLWTWFQCEDAPIGALDGTPCARGAVCVRGECQRGYQIIQ